MDVVAIIVELRPKAQVALRPGVMKYRVSFQGPALKTVRRSAPNVSHASCWWDRLPRCAKEMSHEKETPRLFTYSNERGARCTAGFRGHRECRILACYRCRRLRASQSARARQNAGSTAC